MSLIPCPHQGKYSWVCKWPICKPDPKKCNPIKQNHRIVGRGLYGSSFQCMIEDSYSSLIKSK
jgi:hypothetical protein